MALRTRSCPEKTYSYLNLRMKVEKISSKFYISHKNLSTKILTPVTRANAEKHARLDQCNRILYK